MAPHNGESIIFRSGAQKPAGSQHRNKETFGLRQSHGQGNSMNIPSQPHAPSSLEREIARFDEMHESNHRIMLLLQKDLERQLTSRLASPFLVMMLGLVSGASLVALGAAFAHFVLR